MDFQLPYYKGTLPLHVPDKNLKHVLVNHAEEFHSDRSEADIVRDALAAPIGTPPLSALAQGKQNILVITSDHTRSMPSGITMPILLEEIRKGQPDASITILIATGLHRPTTQEELLDRFGPDIVARERIVVHNAFQPEEMRYVCQLPSGAGLSVNRLALESDLIVSEGFIEPHFFAGFSGGRWSTSRRYTSTVSPPVLPTKGWKLSANWSSLGVCRRTVTSAIPYSVQKLTGDQDWKNFGKKFAPLV